MPKLKKIVVAHTTAKVSNAGSNAEFTLVIQRPPPAQQATMPFPSNPGDDRLSGNLDIYDFDLKGKNIDSDDPGFDILMSINTGNPGDEWLPASMFVLGQTTDNNIIILGDHYEWPEDRWFNKKTGQATHQISTT
jgi:hypothetical protein